MSKATKYYQATDKLKVPQVGRPKAKPRKTRGARPKPTPKQALLRIPAPPLRPWELTEEQVRLVKSQICKGATDEEFKFCMAVARSHRLNPLRGQIWFIPRHDSELNAKRWIPIVGINGLRHIGARDYADYGSEDEPEFGPMHEVEWHRWSKGRIVWTGKLQAPEWAKVAVWRKGSDRPTVATVWWDEIYPNIDYSPTVRQMGRLMLGKCASAQAIRKAYPATDGLYIREEFQGRPHYTEEGRLIVYPETPNLEEATQAFDAGNEDLKRFEEREKAQLAALAAAQTNAKEKNDATPQKPASSAHIAPGAEVRPSAKQHEDGPVGPDSGKPAAKPAARRDAKPAPAEHRAKGDAPRHDRVPGPPRADIPGELHTINGFLQSVTQGVSKNKSNFRRVVVKPGTVYFCFDNKERMIDGDTKDSTFALLDQAKAGVPISFLCRSRIVQGKPMPELVTLLRISNLEWELDGTPIIQRGFDMREPGDE